MNKEPILDIYQILETKGYIPRKWELIERLLTFCIGNHYDIVNQEQYTKALEIADEIDTALNETYTQKTTLEWNGKWNVYRGTIRALLDDENVKLILEFVRDTFGHTFSCVGCDVTETETEAVGRVRKDPENCRLCKFGHKHGICRKNESLYSEFRVAFNNALGLKP